MLHIAPTKIEQTDWTKGWTPDLEPTSVPPTALVRVRNLLPNAGDGTLQTRKGYKALLGILQQGYTIRTLHPFNRTGGENYLIVVGTTDQPSVADNVKVWAYNLNTEILTAISPGTKVWSETSGHHYGFSVDDTFYGGSEGDPMYSWNPDDGWDDNASQVTYAAFVDDKSYKAGAKVSFNGTNYVVRKGEGNRPRRKWKNDTGYDRGDLIRHKPGATTYWRAFKARKDHQVEDGAKSEPGVGTEWTKFWKEVNLPDPVDSDGDLNEKVWQEIPDAPVTKLAVWWANRMWARPDNHNKQMAMYSSMVDPITLEWDPTDWSAYSEHEGFETVTGAGFIPFKTTEGDKLSAFTPYGTHMLVFTQKRSFVLTGENPETQYRRELAPMGCVGVRAACEHEGLVYFMSDEGLFYTDATELQPVPGTEHIKQWIADAVRWDGNLDFVTMWSFDGFLWISLPTGNDRVPDRTLVYDSSTQSFWPIDLAPVAVAINRKDGVDRLFFSLETDTGMHVDATYAWTGTANRSTSTRTNGAVVETNLIKNPDFEARDQETHIPFDWDATHPLVKMRTSKVSARSGNKGVEVTNKAELGAYIGITQTFADVDTSTHTISIYARRPNWQKTEAAPPVKALIAGVEIEPTFDKIGRGWWRVSHSYTGSTTPREKGFGVKPGRTVEFDMAMCTDGTIVSYFDGDGGAPNGGHVVGGADGKVYTYGFERNSAGDVEELTTDDGTAIGWSMRTAWFPFGTVREERRIRRVWVLARGSAEMIIRGFANYEPEQVTEAFVTGEDDQVTRFFEGQVGDYPASYSVAFEIEGESSPAAVSGVGVDTQRLRVGRFGS